MTDRRVPPIDEALHTCALLLEVLVEARFLVRDGHGAYARLTDGSGGLPSLRVAKASLNLPRARNVRAS